MTHALILRFLRLPLIMSLCFTTATVVSEPFGRADVETAAVASSQFESAETVAVATHQAEHPVDSDVARPEDSADDDGALAGVLMDTAESAQVDLPKSTAKPLVVEDQADQDQAVVPEEQVGPTDLKTGKGLPASDVWNHVGSAIATSGNRKLDFPKTLANLAVRASEVPTTTDVVDGQVSPQVTASERNTVVVSNDREAGYSVSFLLDNEVRTLKPGESTSVQGSSVPIRFDRGRGAGIFDQHLEPGHYRFQVEPSGWTLSPVEPASR